MDLIKKLIESKDVKALAELWENDASNLRNVAESIGSAGVPLLVTAWKSIDQSMRLVIVKEINLSVVNNYVTMMPLNVALAEDALLAAEKQTDTSRSRVTRKSHKNSVENQVTLASSLHNLSFFLNASTDLNDKERSLKLAIKALEIRETLVKSYPNNVDHKVNLSQSLHGVSVRLRGLKRSSEAVPYIEKCVQMRRQLHEDGHLPTLKLVMTLRDCSTINGSLDRLLESIQYHIKLYKEDPIEHATDFSRTLHSLSIKFLLMEKHWSGFRAASLMEAIIVKRMQGLSQRAILETCNKLMSDAEDMKTRHQAKDLLAKEEYDEKNTTLSIFQQIDEILQ